MESDDKWRLFFLVRCGVKELPVSRWPLGYLRAFQKYGFRVTHCKSVIAGLGRKSKSARPLVRPALAGSDDPPFLFLRHRMAGGPFPLPRFRADQSLGRSAVGQGGCGCRSVGLRCVCALQVGG